MVHWKCIAVITVVLFSHGAIAEAQNSAKSEHALGPDLVTYHKQVKPLVATYCLRCHGPKKSKGDIRFDTIDPDIVKGEHTLEWGDVREQFNTGEMPPEDENQPSAREREIISLWLDREFKKARRAGNPNKKGNVRRLTRYELRYSLEDLLNVPAARALEAIPEETRSPETGFKNNAKLLTLTDSHMESYYDALWAILSKIPAELERETFSAKLDATELAKIGSVPFMKVEPWRAFCFQIPHSNYGVEQRSAGLLLYGLDKRLLVPTSGKARGRGTGGWIVLKLPRFPKGLFRISVEVEAAGTGSFTFAIEGKQRQPGMNLRGLARNAIMGVKLPFDTSSDVITVESHGDAHPLIKYNGDCYLRLSNRSKGPVLIKSVEFHGNLNGHIKNALYDPAIKPGDTKGHIRSFAQRALRRPVTDQELDDLFDSFKSHAQEQSELHALLSTYEEILCLPEFFHIGLPAGQEKTKDENFLLAEKLAYFLWSSVPDRALLDAAAAGQLTDKAVLSKHVARMLQDKKSKRLVEHLADQWLHAYKFDYVNVAPKYYPGFDGQEKLVKQETIEAVDDVVRYGASALNLLKADHIFVNEPLADFYGIDGVEGWGFRKVKLPEDSPRGGLLTQATFLVANSDGQHSHAIKRGVWLTEVLLNDPPPAPPGAVPGLDDLEETTPGFNKMSLNQKMLIHRDNDACRNCHNKIDPWGILFENFDASGSWREKVLNISTVTVPAKGKRKERTITQRSRLEVENSAILPSGETLTGIQELKDYLVEKRSHDFCKGVTEKLLAYALSRDVAFYDEELVEDLSEKFAASDYSVKTLIDEIVTCKEFMKGAQP